MIPSFSVKMELQEAQLKDSPPVWQILITSHVAFKLDMGYFVFMTQQLNMQKKNSVTDFLSKAIFHEKLC
jgi:hypothetical protein